MGFRASGYMVAYLTAQTRSSPLLSPEARQGLCLLYPKLTQ